MLATTGITFDAGQPVYQQPTGFWLQPNRNRTELYGPMRRDANWVIEQWGIPQDLPPFNAAGNTQNSFAQVRWLKNGRYELSQNSAGLPCLKTYPTGRTSVNEFDLFAAPINGNEPQFPQATIDNRKTLSALSHIAANITIILKSIVAVDQSCADTHSTFMYSVVLSNPSRRQFLFYQLRLANFVADDTGMVQANHKPVWFFTGENEQNGGSGQFGFGDNITEYGRPWARIRETQSYQLDLLPRLRWLIQDGARYGLDPDLDDWKLTGTYHGQNSNGHMSNDAIWGDYRLTAEGRDE